MRTVSSRLNAGGGGHACDHACTQSGDKQTTAHLCRLLCSKYLEEVSSGWVTPRARPHLRIAHQHLIHVVAVRAQGDVGKGRELLASAVSLYKEMGDSKMQEQCDVLYGQVAQVRPTTNTRQATPCHIWR